MASRGRKSIMPKKGEKPRPMFTSNDGPGPHTGLLNYAKTVVQEARPVSPGPRYKVPGVQKAPKPAYSSKVERKI